MKIRLEKNIIEAMKSGNKELLSALKMIKNEIYNKEKESNKELSEIDLVSLLKNMRKKRNESIEFFKKGDREDLIRKEQSEIDVIDAYLPKQMTEEEIVLIVEQVIAVVKPESMKDIGKVLEPIKTRYGNVIDMAFVSKLIKDRVMKI